MTRPGPRTTPPRNSVVTLVAVALVVLGLWYLRSREPVDVPASAPAADDARRTPSPVPTPAPAPADTSSANEGDRHDLEADEARGGHTLARHVGRTDAELRERLADDRGISTASTYATRAIAERTVARALRANADRVQAWTSRRGSRPNLALDYHGPRDEVLGRSIRRGRAPVDCSDAVVVLRWDGRDSYVLTSYPEPPR